MSVSNGATPQLPVLEDDLLEEIEQMVPRMSAQLEKLDEYRDQLVIAHREQLAAVEERKRRLINILKQVGIDPTPTTPRRKRNSSYHRPIGGRAVREIVKTVLDLGEDARFTVLDLHRSMGEPWGEPQSYAAVNQLREVQFLRKVGQDPDTSRTIWSVMDRHVGEELLERLENRAARPLNTKVSAERLNAVREAVHRLARQEGRTVTIREVMDFSGINKDSVRDGLYLLEEAGEITRGEKRREDDRNRGLPSMTFGPVEMAHA